jgi:hypothetical protein
VQQFFALTGLQEFEGQHYRLKMAGNQLSVEAKDGRGQMLTVDGEKAMSWLESQDLQQFEAARELLDGHLQLPEISKSMTISHPDLEIEA